MLYTEDFLDYPDGVKIRYRLNKSANPNVASVLLIHDVYEHLEMYDYLFPYCDSMGVALHTIELRGFGCSATNVKPVLDITEYVKDIKRFIYGILQQRPLYILGIGFGGLLATKIIEDSKFSNIKGLLLFSPFLNLNFKKNLKWQVRFKSLFFKQQKIRFSQRLLEQWTDDEKVLQQIKKEYQQQKNLLTAGFFKSCLKQQQVFRKEILPVCPVPILILLGKTGIFCKKNLIKKDLQQNPNARKKIKLQIYSNNYHNVLLSKNKRDYLSEIESFIKLVERQNREESEVEKV